MRESHAIEPVVVEIPVRHARPGLVVERLQIQHQQVGERDRLADRGQPERICAGRGPEILGARRGPWLEQGDAHLQRQREREPSRDPARHVGERSFAHGV